MESTSLSLLDRARNQADEEAQSGQGTIDRYHMSYTTPTRAGTIQLERAKLRADKRFPAIWTWTVIVRIEEWPAEKNSASADFDPALLIDTWKETNDPQRSPVHTLHLMDNGEFHESGPMVMTVLGEKHWITKDLDGDGKEEILPFRMSGSWELKEGHLLTETTSSNVLGFKNERPGNQRRFRIEALTQHKLVLVLLGRQGNRSLDGLSGEARPVTRLCRVLRNT